jgi:cobalt-zinc-cadmium efflux system membrane fusion protein
MIEIEPEIQEKYGILVEGVEEHPVSNVTTLPATVAAPSDAVAHVGTTVSGRVVELKRTEGDGVGRNSALLVLESIEIGKARSEYVEAVASMERLEKSYVRHKELAGENITSQRELEETESQLQAARANVREAKAHLRTIGIDPSTVHEATSNRHVVRSPIAGIVAEQTVTLGEYVGPGDDLFSVVNTSQVWVNAKATSSQLEQVAVGQRGTITTTSGEALSGTVSYISPVVDSDSRRVTVRLTVPNRNGLLRIDDYVTLQLETALGGRGVRVPAAALERDADKTYVYLAQSPTTFRRTEVSVTGEANGHVLVSNGLEPGQAVATGGVFYLKSALREGELSEHHH